MTKKLISKANICTILAANSQTILPASTTALVCCEVPEAMFVRAQAASNCKEGLKRATEMGSLDSALY